MDPSAPRVVERRPHPVADTLAVFALSALAVTQPLFDLLGRNASFFVAHRASRTDVVLLTIAVVLVPPTALVAIRVAIRVLSQRASDVFHFATVGVLAALALTPPVFRAWSPPWPLALAIAVVVAVGAVALLSRSTVAARALSVMAVGAVVFPALFLFVSPARDLLFPQRLPESRPVANTRPPEAKTPVTVVLFDELALSSIVTPSGRINGDRFPNLARLAGASTWYTNATTSGLRTDQAVPAVLTGRRVPKRQVPSSFAYPQNLFTLLAPTHELYVHEHVTQLCPPDVCKATSQRSVSGLRPLFRDAAVVYGHIVLPPDAAASLLPPLGDRWAGFTRSGGEAVTRTGTRDPVSSWLRSRLIATREQHEGDVFARFLDELEPGKPQLSWVHSQVPHPPWRYLPSGQTYLTGGGTPGYHDFRWSANQYLTDLVLQRSLLQTKFADELVGDLIDRLERSRLWDDTLLVVLADHGATWEAGTTRRDLDGKQGSTLIGVPLFVKYPQQEKGRVDPSNVELVDVVPTIADVVGVDVPWETHGSSLLDRARRPSKIVFDGRRERTMSYSFDDITRRAAELGELFGEPGDPDDLFGFGPDRDLLGKAAEPLDAHEIRSVAIADAGGYNDIKRGASVLPAMFRARLNTDGSGGERVAVAVNGTIAGVGETFTEEGGLQVAIMLSPHYFRDGRNEVKLYWVVDP